MNNAEADAFGEKIDPEWFKWVIHRLDSSIRKLGADADIDRTEKTILRAVKSGTIRPELLDQIAKKLDVYPDYLAGRYAWTLNLDIMKEEGVLDYWREHYLNPKQFPYKLAEQLRLGSYRQLIDTLLIHGISEAEYKGLSWDKRHELERELDRQTTRILNHWFPDHARPVEDLEYFQTMEWQDERDVIEAMLDYLEDRGLVTVYDQEPDDDSEDPFFEEYKHLPVVSMPTMSRIVIKGESGFCSVDEAFTDMVVITPDWISYKYKPRKISEHNLPMSWAYQPSGLGYRALFDEVAEKVAGILELDDEEFVTDIGSTTFAVAYPNGTKKHRVFCLPGDDFAECFALVKKMVPSEEAIPRVLITSDNE